MSGYGWRWGVMLGVLVALASLGWSQAALPTNVTMEQVRTPQGTALLWRRVPADAGDLLLPFYPDAQALDSVVYRVRDRKRRDLLRVAMARFTVTAPPAAIADYYRQALGASARMANEAAGTLTLSVGTPDDLRLITMRPTESGTQLVLERTQRFTVPARVYTPAETRVKEVMARIAETYRTAPGIRMRILQQAEFPNDATRVPEPLRWTVEFARPATLHVTAAIGATQAFAMTTRDQRLIIEQHGREEERPLPAAGITAELLPELYGNPDDDPVGDPVIRFLLGGALITDSTDYLLMTLPAGQPGEIVLTYPEDAYTLRLYFDPATKIVTKSIVDRLQDGSPLRVIREYQDVTLTTTPPASVRETTPPAQ